MSQNYKREQNIELACQSIRPIVLNRAGLPCFLRTLTKAEFGSFDFSGVLLKSTDFAEMVDFTKLSLLEDIKILHKVDSNSAYFSANLKEIVAQLPIEYLEYHRVMAIQIIYQTTRLCVRDYTTFKKDFEEGYNVSIVRLYSQKMPDRPEAHPLYNYPDDSCIKPRMMTEREFSQFKKLFSQFET